MQNKMQSRLVVDLWTDIAARIALVFVGIVFAIAHIGALVLDDTPLKFVDTSQRYLPPSADFWLGTDLAGRDVLTYLIFATSNSLNVALGVTIIVMLVGTTLGLCAGYFGNRVDDVVMRIVDFFMVLPSLMFIIAFISLVPGYTVWQFVLILALFGWMSDARLFRSKALAERNQDYIAAAKLAGNSNPTIIIKHLLPNVSSLFIVTLVLGLAGNIGIETGLTFLGFGLPRDTPSLGTMLFYALSTDVLVNKWWVWLPAMIVIVGCMISINFIGETIKKTVDKRQK